MSEAARLRFGVMCDQLTFPAWQASCIQKLIDSGEAELHLLIRKGHVPVQRRRRGTISSGRRNRLWLTYDRLYVVRRSAAMHRVDLSDLLSGVPTVLCRPDRSGECEYFAEPDLIEIQRKDLDFILRFSFDSIQKEIYELARFGVWAFDQGDQGRYRGSPPCFREMSRGDPITVVQLLKGRPDGEVTLQQGFFRTHDYSYARTLDAALMSSARWPAKVARDIRNGAASYLHDSPTRPSAWVSRIPTDIQLLRFLATTMLRFVSFQARTLLRSEQWNVGIVRTPIQSFLGLNSEICAEWLPARGRKSFVADPFCLRRGKDTLILVEDFDYRTNVGRVALISRMGDGRVTSPRQVIKTERHASYPYVIEHAGQIYCVPETAADRRAVLYRAEDFPERWEQVATLIDDFAAVDPTLCQYGRYWWLFCTDGDAGLNTDLHIFYAKDIAGPWRPHAQNPVKTDIRSARPAGTPFFHRGVLYRPSQDSSRKYGGAVMINRVLTLTPVEFAEEVAAAVRPRRDCEYGDGLHTLSAAGDWTLVDGKKRVFVWLWFRSGLRHKAARIRDLVARSG